MTRNSMILVSDEFVIGMFFTILHDLKEREEIPTPFGTATETKVRFNKGGVYRIKQIQRPFIVYEYMTPRGEVVSRNLDARELHLMSLTEEYVRALQPTFWDYADSQNNKKTV